MRKVETSEDVERVVAMGVRMHPRSRFSRWPLDTNRAFYILNQIKDADTVFAHYMEHDRRIVAILVGEVATDHSVDVRIASTLMLYAEETGLGALNLCRLIRVFEAWAAGRADLVSIDVSGGVQDERLAGLLERRMGYGDGGRRVVKEIGHGA